MLRIKIEKILLILSKKFRHRRLSSAALSEMSTQASDMTLVDFKSRQRCETVKDQNRSDNMK